MYLPFEGYLHKATHGTAAQFILQTQNAHITTQITSVIPSSGYIKGKKVPYCYFEVHFNDSFTDVVRVVSVLWY